MASKELEKVFLATSTSIDTGSTIIGANDPELRDLIADALYLPRGKRHYGHRTAPQISPRVKKYKK